MMTLVRVLLHGAWIVPLFLGRPYLAVALLLAVSLCYVKVFKFRQQLADLAQEGGHPEDEATLRNRIKRWQTLTWLRGS